jgi:hypothetical protein
LQTVSYRGRNFTRVWSWYFLHWICLSDREHRWDFSDIILCLALISISKHNKVGFMDLVSEQWSTNQVIVEYWDSLTWLYVSKIEEG